MIGLTLEKLVDKIEYELLSWYLDEGDYQPTKEQARKKIKSLIISYAKSVMPEEKVLKRLLDYINRLSPHNLWHPHDIYKPVEERRINEGVKQFLDEICSQILERIKKDEEV